MIQRQYWKYIVYTLMALYVVYIVASMSYLNNLIREGQSYTLAMGRDAREIRTRCNELENILPGLYSSADMRLSGVLRELKRIETKQAATFQRLEKSFSGNRHLLATLKAKLEQLETALRDGAEQLEGNFSYDLANAYFRNTLRPLILAIDEDLNEIGLDIDRHAIDLQKSIHESMQLIILSSIVFGVLIILMTVFYDRRVRTASRELAYREELFRQLARNIDEVFIIALNAHKFEYVGPNCVRLLNIGARDLYQDPILLYNCLPAKDGRWLADILDGPSLSEPVEREFDVPDLDKIVRVQVYSIHVPSTGQERFIVVISDQTETMRRQYALSDALESAHAASAAKSSFLSHMSHEIRTPMNAIIGMTTIALTRINDQARVQDCLCKIAESSRHLLGLINDVLDMSKIESGKLSICHENFNLHHAIETISNIVRPQTQSRKQNFEILLENVDEENLVGDAMRFNQILLNILSNAVKFTPEDGSVVLKIRQLEKSGKNVCFRITISDTGIGMSPEFLERLYKPFEQAESNTASRYGGTGLGMPITSNLVTMMGGAISVESEQGAGTTFTVELPFELSGEACYRSDSLPPLRILIVDDDSGTCEHASLLLEKMGLSPSWTLSGAEAVEMVRKAHKEGADYDVCLIDWRMPGMDGAATARAIREVVGEDMLIIIISAYDLAPIEDEARAAGVNDFIAKPFFASTLFDALASITCRLDSDAIQQAAASPSYDFSGKRVLLVEDNEFNREIGQEFLEMVNIEVEHAENGKEAVEMVERAQAGYYDLVLMDVQMPIMDGYEATRTIRASSHPGARTVPIVAMTANAFSEDIAKAVSAGMNSHLAKPIDVNELYRLLARYLGKQVNNVDHN